ncbi:12244_t:CDS:2 [Acaulospora colombiana]|uniref:12244_t:CDS:1 n=1 Tax=Acaulospora colombiana TaxID=27376 RepID=A0ACA9NVG5_9GLOM|nr:12244_t:CDS:2 [Acaulospora colombiana]
MTPDGDLTNLRVVPFGMIPFDSVYAIATPEGDLIIFDPDLLSDTGGANALVFCVPSVEMVDATFLDKSVFQRFAESS